MALTKARLLKHDFPVHGQKPSSPPGTSDSPPCSKKQKKDQKCPPSYGGLACTSMETSLAPSPMASVMAFLSNSCTLPIFNRGWALLGDASHVQGKSQECVGISNSKRWFSARGWGQKSKRARFLTNLNLRAAQEPNRNRKPNRRNRFPETESRTGTAGNRFPGTETGTVLSC